MQKSTLLWIVVALAAFSFTAACGDEETTPAEEGAGGGTVSIVPQGKADDFFSDVAQEYTVTGITKAQTDSACFDAAEDSREWDACMTQGITLKNFAVAWFLNQYVIDKHDSANEDWGGFTGMTRPAGFQELDVGELQDDGSFEYIFEGELSGPLSLLSKVETYECGSARCFDLVIPVIDYDTLAKMETGSEWYRSGPYSEYSPDTYDGEKETVQLEIKAYPRSNDAYLEYNKLFSADQMTIADDKLKVSLFVGWDYYEDRYDLQTAKELYRYLTSVEGFTSPVADYDAYKIDSGPFTKTIKVNGKEVAVEVELTHPGQGDPGNPEFAGAMKNKLIAAFSDSQVISFEGHAGPLYGFALGNWRATEAGELDDTELPGLDIPADFYQVVMISGCDTYMVADALYENPVKVGRKDLDVITTTSFSNAAGRGRTTKALVDAVINQDARGELEPETYGNLLRKLNSEYYMTPLYGVHGIDDNPRANPFAPDNSCTSCSADTDCGGFGNRCVEFSDTDAFCAPSCQTDEDCGGGEVCKQVAEGNTIVSSLCLPETLTCE